MSKFYSVLLAQLFDKCFQISQANDNLYNFHGVSLGHFDLEEMKDIKLTEVNPLVAKSAKCLLSHLQSIGVNYLAVHFEDMQEWIVPSFNRNNEYMVPPYQFARYRMVALSDSLRYFKNIWPIGFIFSGTNLKLKQLLRWPCDGRLEDVSLPLLSEDAIFHILETFCNFSNLDIAEIKKNIVSELVGCVRSTEYFLSELSVATRALPLNEVSMKILTDVCLF